MQRRLSRWRTEATSSRWAGTGMKERERRSSSIRRSGASIWAADRLRFRARDEPNHEGRRLVGRNRHGRGRRRQEAHDKRLGEYFSVVRLVRGPVDRPDDVSAEGIAK